MSVLNNQEILTLCQNKRLIEKYDPDNIKGASYDMRLGNQYYIYSNSNINLENRFEIKHLCDGQQIVIPPGEVCYASTKEILYMPNDLCANVSLPLGLVLEGLMLSKQPPIDPGYNGGIICMLHNLSDNNVYIKANAKILTIEFNKLVYSASQLYEGKYKDKFSLDQYMNKPITSGLYQLREETRKYQNRFARLMPVILTIITILVACISVYVAWSNYSINKSSHEAQIIGTSEQDKTLIIKLPDGRLINVKYDVEASDIEE
jgi:deoxycytidine triphosphate deaminase